MQVTALQTVRKSTLTLVDQEMSLSTLMLLVEVDIYATVWFLLENTRELAYNISGELSMQMALQ